MALVYEKVVEEDLNLGHGAVTVTNPAGGTMTGNKIGIHTLIGELNVKDFGAVGDGVAIDRVAIQAALDANLTPKGVVYVPQGTYLINGYLTVRPGTTLRGVGGGSIIKATANTFKGLILSGDCDNAVIEDLVLEGANVARNILAPGIDSGSADNVTIQNCEIKYWGYQGIATGAYPTNWKVLNNYVHDNYDEGIYFGLFADGNLIEGNIVFHNGTNGIDYTGCNGIISKNRVHGNGFANISTDIQGILIYSPGAAYPVRNVIVSDNISEGNAGSGIFVSRATGGVVEHVIVKGNDCYLNLGSGIFVEYSSVQYIIVSGNNVHQNTQYGVMIESSNNNIITGNVAYLNGDKGFALAASYANPTNNLISGNFALNNVAEGFYISGDALGNMIGENVSSGNTPNFTMAYYMSTTVAPFQSLFLASLTTTERLAIITPTAGKIVYDSTVNKPYCYNGTRWEPMTTGTD